MVRRGTYSIVARDPDTGELGAAVQSHWFSVGSIVTWARPGVGAVCTQSVAEPAYGPRLLDALEAGVPARGTRRRPLVEHWTRWRRAPVRATRCAPCWRPTRRASTARSR